MKNKRIILVFRRRALINHWVPVDWHLNMVQQHYGQGGGSPGSGQGTTRKKKTKIECGYMTP